MEHTTLQQWKNWATEYTLLPYLRSYPLDQPNLLDADWLETWQQAGPYSFVLESGKAGRYTYLGLRPRTVVRGKDHDAELIVYDAAQQVVRLEQQRYDDPLVYVREWLSLGGMPHLTDVPPLLGGAVGYWAYDLVRQLESLPALAQDDVDVPDFVFMKFDEVWIVDHEQAMLYIAVTTSLEPSSSTEQQLAASYDEAASRAETLYEQWKQWMGAATLVRSAHRKAQYAEIDRKETLQVDPDFIAGVHKDFSREAFIEAVEKIQSYIRAGDVHQVNLTLRQHRKLDRAPEEIYEWLRLVNPSPYMGMLRFPDFQIVSGSPELLIKLNQGKMTTRPIAGTRKRGKNDQEDQQLVKELQENIKERTEHLMLVELLREEFEEVSQENTVQVDELMTIEAYSHVSHLVSSVSGMLGEDYDALDILRAIFPGATITGTPKRRTLELIEELEPVRRGIYTGSIGWIDYRGDMEFNIVIRTLVVKNGTGYVQAGAGIVQDSIPEREYDESIQKAKAVWKAIQLSELTEQAVEEGTP